MIRGKTFIIWLNTNYYDYKNDKPDPRGRRWIEAVPTH